MLKGRFGFQLPFSGAIRMEPNEQLLAGRLAGHSDPRAWLFQEHERRHAMNLLIVEDDEGLASALSQILKEAGNSVDVANDGEAGYLLALQGTYDVAILDVMLPKKNGFDVVASLRREGVSTPVLMLTARDAVPDKIRGFDSGADDYMTKPFAPAELMAHLRALTRRRGEVEFETIEAFGITLDLNAHELRHGAESIHLSGKEFSLAHVLMANAGKTVPKATIIEKVWGAAALVEENNVEAYVSFLRKKLRFLGADAHIETIRGVGYGLVEGAHA